MFETLPIWQATKQYPPFVLIIISLIRSEIVPLFLCLLTIYISSYMNCFKGSINSLVKLALQEDCSRAKIGPSVFSLVENWAVKGILSQ